MIDSKHFAVLWIGSLLGVALGGLSSGIGINWGGLVGVTIVYALNWLFFRKRSS